jgi:hypothetical protein
VWDILGAILTLAGIVLCKLGLRKPKEKSLEERVNEAVEKRLADLQLQGSLAVSPVPPAAAAPRPVPVPVDVPPPAPRAPTPPPAGPRCPKCGRLLVAGGKLCRNCDMA